MKPYDSHTQYSRTRSAQRRISTGKFAKTRKSTTDIMTNYSESDIVLLPENQQNLFDELQNLANTIVKNSLKQDINTKIHQLIDTAKSIQKETELHTQNILSIDNKMTEKDTEIKSLQEKLRNKQATLDEITQEGENQVKELTKITKEQQKEITQQKEKIERLQSTNEEQKEYIKTLEEENQGLLLAITSLNNAISQNKERNHKTLNTKTLTGLNNSLNFSLLEHTMQDELNETNNQDKKQNSKNENTLKNNKDTELTDDKTTKPINKEIHEVSETKNAQNIDNKPDTNKTTEIIDITENKNDNDMEYSPQRYISPHIIIQNNKALQKELENENIINKKKTTNKGKSTEKIDKISPYEEEDIIIEEQNENNKNSTIDKILIKKAQDKYEDLDKKIKEIEEMVKNNTNKIKTVENKLNPKTTIDLSKTNTITKEHNCNCYIIGDSHLKYVSEEICKDKEWTNKFQPKVNFKPGYQLKDITNKLIPKNIKEKDILVICGGTNDLYHTSTEEIKRQINIIGKIGCTTFIILVPPQKHRHNNYNISGLNTVIKYECEKYKNLFIINTHKFIQPRHIANDGIHLGQKAKIWLSHKIMKTVEKYSSKLYTKQNKATEHNKTNTARENSYGQARNVWTTNEGKDKTGTTNIQKKHATDTKSIITHESGKHKKPKYVLATNKKNLNNHYNYENTHHNRTQEKTEKTNSTTPRERSYYVNQMGTTSSYKKYQDNGKGYNNQRQNSTTQQTTQRNNKINNGNHFLTMEQQRNIHKTAEMYKGNGTFITQNTIEKTTDPTLTSNNTTHTPNLTQIYNHNTEQSEPIKPQQPLTIPHWNRNPQHELNFPYNMTSHFLPNYPVTPYWQHHWQTNQPPTFFPYTTQFLPRI